MTRPQCLSSSGAGIAGAGLSGAGPAVPPPAHPAQAVPELCKQRGALRAACRGARSPARCREGMQDRASGGSGVSCRSFSSCGTKGQGWCARAVRKCWKGCKPRAPAATAPCPGSAPPPALCCKRRRTEKPPAPALPKQHQQQQGGPPWCSHPTASAQARALARNKRHERHKGHERAPHLGGRHHCLEVGGVHAAARARQPRLLLRLDRLAQPGVGAQLHGDAVAVVQQVLADQGAWRRRGGRGSS